MHPQALEKISNKIRGSLKNCMVQGSWPQYESFSVHVDSLADEVIKHKKEWLDAADVFSIFYDFVNDAITSMESGGEELEGNLWVILGEENAESLTERMKEYFHSIPRKFDVYLPIPRVTKNLPTPIELSETISLVSFQTASQIPGGYSAGILSLGGGLK